MNSEETTYYFEIMSLNSEGEGVGRLQNLVVFIPYTAPKDLVKVKNANSNKSYLRPEEYTIVRPSIYRVVPQCKYFRDCKGCRLQHLDYAAQLSSKASSALDNIIKIAGLSRMEIAFTFLSPPVPRNIYNYRHYARLHVHSSGFLGYYGASGHLEIDSCPILDGKLSDLLPHLQVLSKEGLGGYSESPGDIKLYSSRTRDEVGVLLVPAPKTTLDENRYLNSFAMIKETFPEAAVGLLSEEGLKTLDGKDYIRDERFGSEIKIPLGSFIQNNPEGEGELIRIVLEFLSPDRSKEGIDGYCGIGVLTEQLSSRVGRVLGIDSNPFSFLHREGDIVETTEKSSGRKISYIGGRLEDHIESAGTIDFLVVNPPGTGLSARMVELLVKSPVPCLIYVSCNSATLGRDLSKLFRVMKIEAMQMVDMFPQTHLIETVVKLVRL